METKESYRSGFPVLAGKGQRVTAFARAWRGPLAVFLLAFLLGGALFGGVGAQGDEATRAQTALDQELRHARQDLGVPAALLAPIEAKERQTASQWEPWRDRSRDAAIYRALDQQALAVEATSLQTLRQQTSSDLQTLTLTLNGAHSRGVLDATQYDAYQARLLDVQRQAGAAATPGQFALVDAGARGQLDALRALEPTAQKLRALAALTHALQRAGIPSPLGQSASAQDAVTFDGLDSARGYATLSRVIDGQIMQLFADSALAPPYAGKALLDIYQTRINQLRDDGEQVAAFQRQHDDDARTLAAARSAADYLSLAQALTRHTDALLLPLARGQARRDLRDLQALIAEANRQTTLDHFTGARYPAAYEYADPERGVGVVERAVAAATGEADYLAADGAALTLSAHLHALLDNLRDPTPHDQAHKADLDLLRRDGAFEGRAVVISLREQTARFYDGGRLAFSTYVTTGRPERPSPPGLHDAMQKLTPAVLTSTDAPDSPFYFQPTRVSYAIEYQSGGFLLHDAWWRHQFGPGTNLPHNDPIAFNGGSHGCVNIPAAIMPKVYDWVTLNTPIVVY